MQLWRVFQVWARFAREEHPPRGTALAMPRRCGVMDDLKGAYCAGAGEGARRTSYLAGRGDPARAKAQQK